MTCSPFQKFAIPVSVPQRGVFASGTNGGGRYRFGISGFALRWEEGCWPGKEGPFRCDAKIYPMKTVTVRDLRYDFPKVERLLREGKSLRVTKRGKVIAKLEPESAAVEYKRPPLPDFEARLKEIYGDKVFEVSGADLISADREDRI